MDELFRYVVIDDNENVAIFINKVLGEREGYYCEQSFTYLSDAICYLKKNRVDVVFLDLGLPDMNGLEIFDNIAQLPHVVVITSFVKRFAPSVCHHINKGISAFLEKPIDEEKLVWLMEDYRRQKNNQSRKEKMELSNC